MAKNKKLKTSRSFYFLPILLFFGLAYAFIVTNLGPVGLWHDAEAYFEYAKNLLVTGVYGYHAGIPDMQREPGYSTFLAICIFVLKNLGITNSSFLVSSLAFIQSFLTFLFAYLASYKSFVPRYVKTPLFFLLIFSPTMIGIQREIYSEALAVLLSLGFIWAWGRYLEQYVKSKSLDNRFTSSIWLSGLSGLIFGSLILTKAYLVFAAWGFALFGFVGLVFKYKKILRFGYSQQHFKKLCVGFFIVGTVSSAMNGAWWLRNYIALGNDRYVPRKSIAIAGKIARINSMQLPEDLPVALAASIGSNFCDQVFSSTRCKNFDYRGCDEIGPATVRDYLKKYPNPFSAEQALEKDMKKLYFRRPFHQIIGSIMEAIRMVFFESVANSSSLPGPLQLFSKAWHFGGSLLFFFLAIKGYFHLRRTLKTKPEGWIYSTAAILIFYHVLVLTQVTNVTRYIYPIIPFIYLFTSVGIACYFSKQAYERNKKT